MAETAYAEGLGPLLARVRARDEVAAGELVERLYPLVAQVVRSHLPRREEPEDLMQEVFLKMFSRLDQYRGEVPFEHWVARISLNTCLDQLRRQKVRPELRWADLTESEQAVVETVTSEAEPADADAPQALTLLNRLLDMLPETDAWLLRQTELEQKSLREVCEAAGWNYGAARVRLFRARRRLQAMFQKLDAK